MARRSPAPAARLLAALALAWLAAVAVLELTGAPSPAAVGSSPDAVADGRLWRLLTSSLIVHGELPLLQLALTAALTWLVLARDGALVWWAAALAGHVGSALLAYAAIGIAIALGSGSAERTADDWDYGVSCVMAALAGVLFAGSVRRLRDGRGDRLDALVLAACALLALAWLTQRDWYGLEHPLAFALGAAVAVAAGSGARAPARGARRAR